jgi:hypothetical protein
MEKIFDLVIFDEASQCFVENGIPAMYRGKQIVIAGDDKQLKPNDLYQVRWEDDDNDKVELDFESLLGLGNQYLMQAQLNGHYRSKNLGLINFSNEHFYGNRLSMLPDFNELNEDQTAIDYVKVEGFWHQNTNLAEAQRVTTIVHDLITKRPNLTIGIVTFNAKQQLFILDHLDEYAAEHRLTWPESLIVKNIENIQGDEKDVIIFSTVYAPDLNEKMKMNFGSLNAEGGENRLNVAITRAKEKIYLVTSIWPEQLKVEDSKNEGPKLLKKYLAYAQQVSEGKAPLQKQEPKKHTSDWYLKNKLSNMDFSYFKTLSMDQSISFVDLTLKHKNKYLSAILTDDERYHGDISIKASHVYAPYALKQKNWSFTTIHSRHFWMDRNQVKEQIDRMISRASE